jgi:hypothetical protein
MLNPKHPFGGLPPAVVDHQLLLVAVGTVAYWLILRYYKGESRKVRNLRVLVGRNINANWSVFQTEFIPTRTPPTGNLSLRISRRLNLPCRFSPSSEP